MKKLLMGNEAIAFGAMRAGVQVVTGYPGTPSSEALETVAKHNDGSIYVEWSVNEKTALETAAGAAFAGARVMVTMKQVGLNVASDPLMSLNYVGVKGGMVIVVADDPGPISSQTEQDTRHFSKFAKLALFDPSTPEEAYTMIADAFECSEKYGRPVLFRPTTRVCHSCASVELLDDLPKIAPSGFVKDSRWVIFPRLAYANKFKIEENLNTMRAEFSSYEKNILSVYGKGGKGIATGGVCYAYTREALHCLDTEHKNAHADYKLLKVSTYPFPDKLALEFLQGLSEVLVIEDLDPVIEDELVRLCGLHHLNVEIRGKRSGHTQIAGENTADGVSKTIAGFFGVTMPDTAARSLPPLSAPLPVRPPVLCAGCPHRASFFAVKEATKGLKAVFTGDIGCYTLGNAQPLDMVDTCLCMGAGITVAQGLKRAEPDAVHFAFIGDSTFFHTGIPGVINAVYNQTDIIVVVLDNSTTAMTGNQPHPGMGITMMDIVYKNSKKSNHGEHGETRRENIESKTPCNSVSSVVNNKISIEKILEAINVSALIKVDPLDLNAAKEAVTKLIPQKGVRVLLFESPCIVITKSSNKAVVDTEKCTGCQICIRKFGCPAISLEDGKAVINHTLCTGCGVCLNLCKPSAISLISGGKK
jgi:indolepyruvate ferredoxin oxidoreductase alpha subunit